MAIQRSVEDHTLRRRAEGTVVIWKRRNQGAGSGKNLSCGLGERYRIRSDDQKWFDPTGDPELDRTAPSNPIRSSCAIKDGPQSEILRERFLREARAAAALRHANIAGVFHFGASEQAGRCFYAMELVEGETLEARVRRDGPLDVSTVLEVARQVTVALVAAAGRGLIHRDLKPGNLMLTGGGALPDELEVKVIDFGLAKATAGLDAPGETDLTHGGFRRHARLCEPRAVRPGRGGPAAGVRVGLDGRARRGDPRVADAGHQTERPDR